MLKGTADFVSKPNFLQRASIVELSVGLVIVFAFQRVIGTLINGILLPICGALFGGLSFSNYFVALTSKVTATTLEEAEKQGAVLAYGDFLSTLINFLILLFVSLSVLRLVNRFVGVRTDTIARDNH